MIEKQLCPLCTGDYKLSVVFSHDDSYAVLPDRLLALSDAHCTATCTRCGHVQEGVIKDLDVELETGMLTFGTIVLDDE
jgi:hypothetical protein